MQHQGGGRVARVVRQLQQCGNRLSVAESEFKLDLGPFGALPLCDRVLVDRLLQVVLSIAAVRVTGVPRMGQGARRLP